MATSGFIVQYVQYNSCFKLPAGITGKWPTYNLGKGCLGDPRHLNYKPNYFRLLWSSVLLPRPYWSMRFHFRDDMTSPYARWPREEVLKGGCSEDLRLYVQVLLWFYFCIKTPVCIQVLYLHISNASSCTALQRQLLSWYLYVTWVLTSVYEFGCMFSLVPFV